MKRFADDPDWVNLEQLLSKFNLFDTLDLHWQEVVHSRVLAWLLSPTENHGLGDFFLKNFLQTIFPGDSLPSDWSAATVQSEWHNAVQGYRGRLDLLVIEESNFVLCAVENKVWSNEHSNQLTRYRKALEKQYPNFTRKYVFLSPRATKPEMPEEQEHWTSVGYDVVRQSVQETIASASDSIDGDVLSFLQQYAAALGRYVLGNREARELVGQLYKKHPKAIDFIVANLPNHKLRSAEIEDVLKEIIQRKDGWEVSYCNFQERDGRRLTRFLQYKWRKYNSFHTGTGWGNSKAVVLFEFWCWESSLELHVSVGPGSNQDVRRSLHESIKALGGLEAREQEFVTNRTHGWHTFTIEKGLLNQEDFEDWDLQSIRDKLEQQISDFAQNKFPRINQTIIDCLEKEDKGQQT